MPILIAVNPYKKMDIYSDENIRFYKRYFFSLKRNPNEVGPPVPHLYHIAEAAYEDMINEKKNQCIIISGESGSGKTQSTKIILKYFSVSSLLSDNSQNSPQSQNKDNVSVERQVLDSNPLLEAFGNAKTVRNNNSSRFGKFILVNFTDHGKIISARIYSYLLEKSRVVFISPEERSYHIFYQLILGADDSERKRYQIKPLDYFKILKQGCFEVDETDDKANFLETKECMTKLKFKGEEMSLLFSIVMGILYLGNVDFVEIDDEGSPASDIEPSTLKDFKTSAGLLGLDEPILKEILTIKKLKDPNNNKYIHRNLSVEKAYSARDALAKILYSRLFDYIVNKINSAISNKEEATKMDKDKIRKIGLLDIFGFENFDYNSFEQLCINYANERLQQFFNNHIFKLEQEEYKKEGIDWSDVEFVDNKEIIDLIDDKQLSVFSFLDSEAITPNASDLNFRSKVYKYLSQYEALLEYDNEYICINHYAGEVFYHIDGFMEKNSDSLTQDILDALGNSKNKLVKRIFKKEDEPVDKKKGASKLQSDSLSKQFKKSLDDLMKILSSSNPRYVKCIKPNPIKKPQILHSAEVMEQLLSAGVLEAVKIRKQGYSIRRTMEEFVKRYQPLTPYIDLKLLDQNKNYTEAAQEMLKLLAANPDIRPFLDPKEKLLQMGTTKVFMKDEVKNMLESKLGRIKYVVKLQSTFRGMKIRKRVWKYLRAVKKVQAVWRGCNVRIFVVVLRTAVKLQKAIRFYFYKKGVFKNLRKLYLDSIKQKEEKKKQEELEKLKLLKENDDKQTTAATGNNYFSEAGLANSFLIEEGMGQLGVINETGNDTASNLANKKRNKLSKNFDKDNSISNKESFGDISNTDFQILNSLNTPGNINFLNAKIKGNKKNTKKPYADLLQSNMDFAHEEMKLRLEALTEELGQCRKDKDSLVNQLENQKESLKRKEKEIELIKQDYETNSIQKQIDNYNSNVDRIGENLKRLENSNNSNNTIAQCDHLEELRKLRKEVAEKEGYVDILNLKIDELTNNNSDLQNLNESLKDQLHKRTEKMNKEMTTLYSQIKELEKKKSEAENLNSSINLKTPDDYNHEALHISSHINTNILKPNKSLEELKSENKKLDKKLEEIKSKYEKEIFNVKTELSIKDAKLKEVELKFETLNNQYLDKCESFSNVKIEYDMCKEKIIEMKNKLEELNKNSKLQEYEFEINKMKVEFENSSKKKDNELQEMREAVELHQSQIERLKKMEKALRNELSSKNEEINKRQEMLKQAGLENDKLMDENILIKKDNFTLTSKLELLQIDYKNKIENENKLRQNEIKSLREKEKKYENLISQLKETLTKKVRIIENKKTMNLLLVDLAKIKKVEVQCMETIHYTNSTNIKETLNKIRENEKEILSKYLLFTF